jgi:hypothetical protein
LAIRRAFGDAHHFLPREGLATLVWPVEPVKPPESQVEPSLGGHLEQYQELFFFFLVMRIIIIIFLILILILRNHSHN